MSGSEIESAGIFNDSRFAANHSVEPDPVAPAGAVLLTQAVGGSPPNPTQITSDTTRGEIIQQILQISPNLPVIRDQARKHSRLFGVGIRLRNA